MSVLVDLEYREREERLIVCDYETHRRCYGGLAGGEHWAAASVLQHQQKGKRDRESSEVGYVKRTIYILVKICNPKVKLRRFILFYLFFKYPIKLKRSVSLSHILGNKNHRYIASSSLLELDSNQKN